MRMRLVRRRALTCWTTFPAALLFVSHAAYAQSACQLQLEAAILKITSSGPVRIVNVEAPGTDSENIETTEFVPPHSLRTTITGRLWVAIKPPLPSTMIGGSTFIGQRVVVQNAPIPNPIYEAGTLHATVDPRRYFAINCAGARITLHYELQGSLDKEFPARDAALKKLLAERRTEKIIDEPSQLDIDQQGRPVKLTVGEAKIDGVVAQPRRQTITFTYDPGIRIDPPR